MNLKRKYFVWTIPFIVGIVSAVGCALCSPAHAMDKKTETEILYIVNESTVHFFGGLLFVTFAFSIVNFFLLRAYNKKLKRKSGYEL